MEPALRIRDYSLAYETAEGPVQALSAVDLTVGKGRTLGLVGESGSGKSSLAWSIMRYLPDNAVEGGGSIALAGEELMDKSQSEMNALRGRRMAMVFQDPSTSLNPVLTLGEQIVEVLVRHRAATTIEAREMAEAALARTGIHRPAEILRRYPHEVSGGEKQRVVIATAFACEPELIVFDEPTTALDILTARQILDLFNRLREETGVSALYISHDLGLVSRIAGTVAVIHKGRIVERGPSETVLRNPTDAYTRALVGAVPHPDRWIGTPAPVGEEALLAARDIDVRYGGPGMLSRLFAPAKAAEAGFWGARAVDLGIRPGELLGVVGESGSGKSTMAKVLAGLQDFEGSIETADRRIDRRSQIDRAYRRDVQIVFQHPDASLNPRQRIREILSRPLKLYDLVPKDGIDARIGELLEMVRLPAAFAGRYPHQLSGGEKQRVAIARAFAAEPSLVICDEITAALDVSVQAAVAELLVALQRRTGTACLFITHDLNLIRQLAHRIVVMQHGAIVDRFDRGDALDPGRHPYTRALLEAVPVPPPLPALEGEPA